MGRKNWLRGSRCETRAERRLRKRHQCIVAILTCILIALTSAVIALLVTRTSNVNINIQLMDICIMAIAVCALIALAVVIIAFAVTRISKVYINIQRTYIYVSPEIHNKRREIWKTEKYYDELLMEYVDLFEGDPIFTVAIDETILNQLELPTSLEK